MNSRNRTLGMLVFAMFGMLVAIGAFTLTRNSPRNGPQEVGFAVTIFPQAALLNPEPTQPPVADAAPVATPEPGPAAAPTARAAQYVVQQNDTLWDIALRFGFSSPDAILAANPGLKADFLALGQALTIPGLDFIPPPQPTAPAAAPGENPASLARVKADAGGLRLRREPAITENVITKLSPLTQLRVLGRSTDNFWVQVLTPENTGGWVQVQYLEAVAFSQSSTDTLAQLPVAATAAPAQPGTVFVESPPYLSDLSPRVYEIYRFGQTRGNQPNRFALIGDSNTENPKFFRPFDWGAYNLGGYTYLEDTVRYFKGSFDRTSPAARGGFSTSKALDPSQADAGQCGGESPVACELRLQRPSVALILIGTGDQHSWQGFESRYRQIIDLCIAYGVVPILITKGDDLEHTDNSAPSGYINSVIRRLAAENQLPLLNLSQVLDTLPARGFISDGFHYNWPPDERPADFTPDKMIYGFNQRNLTALQALDIFRRRVIGG